MLTLTLTQTLNLALALTLTLSERNALLWRPVNYNLARRGKKEGRGKVARCFFLLLFCCFFAVFICLYAFFSLLPLVGE